MKIDQSTLSMQSQHASLTLRSQQTTLRAWVGDRRPDFEGKASARQLGTGVMASFSNAARAAADVNQARGQLRQNALSSAGTSQPDIKKADAVTQANDAVRNDPRLRLLIDMVEALTGRSIRVFDARDLQLGSSTVTTVQQTAPTPSAPSAPAASGWGFELDTHQVVMESEITQVSTQGTVRTSDGQEINFSLQLEMSRQFVQETNLSIRAGDAVRKDPLVINFGGTGVELTDAQFAFDLDADGQQENIAFVTGGSGFLTLDKNKDGRVNDGSELFGTRSGDGFADLALLDQDGNQWIDENDAVYKDLRVWQRDANGQDKLSTLAEMGVGALYLGRVSSPFSVNTASNQTLGLVRSSGVFLYESGQAGSLQQVDL